MLGRGSVPRKIMFVGSHSLKLLSNPCNVASAVIGEVDDDKDASLDLESLRAEPLRPVTH